MEERDQVRGLRLEELKKEIRLGMDSGESTPLDMESIKKRGRERLVDKENTK